MAVAVGIDCSHLGFFFPTPDFAPLMALPIIALSPKFGKRQITINVSASMDGTW